MSWKKTMQRLVLVGLALALCLAGAGCLGRMAGAAGKRSGAFVADQYIKAYVEPEVIDYSAGDDPAARKEAKKQTKQARRDLRDTIVQ